MFFSKVTFTSPNNISSYMYTIFDRFFDKITNIFMLTMHLDCFYKWFISTTFYIIPIYFYFFCFVCLLALVFKLYINISILLQDNYTHTGTHTKQALIINPHSPVLMTYFELSCILPFGNAAYIHSDLMQQHVRGSVILAIIMLHDLQEHWYVFLCYVLYLFAFKS